MSANRFNFRCWNMKTKSWVHKEPCSLTGETILLGGWFDGVPIQDLDQVVIMQSTGLCDKNGKEIFEGDILNLLGDYPVEIKFKDGGFGWYSPWRTFVSFSGHNYFNKIMKDCEVKGNIYENPELMESK